MTWDETYSVEEQLARMDRERESPVDEVAPADRLSGETGVPVCGHSGPTTTEYREDRKTIRCGSCGAVVGVERYRGGTAR